MYNNIYRDLKKKILLRFYGLLRLNISHFVQLYTLKQRWYKLELSISKEGHHTVRNKGGLDCGKNLSLSFIKLSKYTSFLTV